MSFVVAQGLASLLRAWKLNPSAPANRLSLWHQHKDLSRPFSPQEIAAFRESLREIDPTSEDGIFADIDDHGRPLPEHLHSLGLLPSWCVLHVPHDSTDIPGRYRSQFILSEEELSKELVAMTDAHTAAMFSDLVPAAQRLRFGVSRLLVDVERFEDDAHEIMSARGMGVVYAQTSGRKPLRRLISDAEREELLATYYRPHHKAFDRMVELTLAKAPRAVIVDAHSFPSKPRPYELDQSDSRPDICIGTDAIHTPPALAGAFIAAFRAEGFTVAENTPFSGSIVPARFYRRDLRVQSVMVEVNRALYMDEATGERSTDFWQVARRVRRGCVRALHDKEA